MKEIILFIKKYKLSILLTFITFFAYLPLFTTKFGFHNDYSMLLVQQGDWLGYEESKHFFVLGRPLGAILVSIQSWFLNTIQDFSLMRLVSYLLSLSTILIIARLLRNTCRLSSFWAKISAFSILTLPTIQLHILWSEHFFPGTFSLLLVAISYYLISINNIEEKQHPKYFNLPYLLLSFFLFLTSLFIYPPTSVFIFSLIFAFLIFTPHKECLFTFRVALRQTLFYIIGLGVYRILDRHIIFPLAEQSGLFNTSTPIALHETNSLYSHAINLNIFNKIPLLFKTLVLALKGTWSLLSFDAGIWINIIIIGLSVFLILTQSPLNIKESSTQYLRTLFKKSFLYKTIFSTGLFLFANAPTILAKNVQDVLGYRVMLSSSTIILFLIISLLILSDQKKKNHHRWTLEKSLATGIFIISCLVAHFTLSDVSRNSHKELDFIQNKVKNADYHSVERFIVVRLGPGESYSNRILPLEFGMLIATIGHVKPIIDEALRMINQNFLPTILINPDEDIYLDDSSELIDLRQIRNGINSQYPENKLAKITTKKTFFWTCYCSKQSFCWRSHLLFLSDFKRSNYPLLAYIYRRLSSLV